MVDFDIIWLDAGLVSLCRHIKSIMPRYDTDWALLEERKALNRFLTKFASSKNFFGQLKSKTSQIHDILQEKQWLLLSNDRQIVIVII